MSLAAKVRLAGFEMYMLTVYIFNCFVRVCYTHSFDSRSVLYTCVSRTCVCRNFTGGD